MSTLAQWQHALAATLDGEPAMGIVLAAANVPGLSAEQGCAIYRGSSRGARIAALADVYPVCRTLLGERSFDGLAGEFVRRVPSDGPDLNRFGDGFATFVDAVVDEQAAFARLPWLAELVGLEWACHQLYYVADDPPLDLARMADTSPTQLIPRPSSSLAWLRAAWPVHRIWSAHDGTTEPGPMAIERGEWHLVVHREGFAARVGAVDADLWRLLVACTRGDDLGVLAADDSLDVTRLGELVERRWLVGVTVRNDVV